MQYSELSNGRVDAISGHNNFNFVNQKNKITENPTNITSRNQSCTRLSDLYFSNDNINILQYGIRNKILNESNGEIYIGRQSDDELKIIMRSIYYQYGKNQKDNIIGQIRELNEKVLEWSIPRIITNLKQYNKYIQDISSMPVPLERSQLTSEKGTKSMELTSFI
jgi:hypothetical protein